MAQRVLLKDGCVLSLDASVGNFHKASVLIEGSKIAAVGPNITAGDAEVIDASGMIVMPGFVDTHRHAWEGILRNIGANVPAADEGSQFFSRWQTLSSAYRPEDVYISTLVAMLGAIHAGITTVLDWSPIQISPEHTRQTIAAHQDSGLRVVFAYGHPWWGDPIPDHDQEFRRIAGEFFSSKDQLLTLALASPGPEILSLEQSKNHWELARSVDARISVHVGVGVSGKQGKLQQMGEAKLLGADTTYVHCATLNDTEIQMIVDTGGTVSLAAHVAMMMGYGMVPTQKFLDRGLRPSLSVDTETSASGEMFTPMRTLLSMQRALAFDRLLAGAGSVPSFLDARDALEFATIEGARANGLLHKVGTLTPGKDADLLMLNTNRINIMPVNDPIGAVVWGMDTGNVDSVFVAGKALKRHGRLLHHDLKVIEQRVRESRDYVIETAGLKVPLV
jgi:5-methylthioadenosine/S-adenosylhomocysteine deaminase